MRRPVTTRAEARSRLVVAERATDDVVRAAAGVGDVQLALPDPVIADVSIARAHVRAAIAALNHSLGS